MKEIYLNTNILNQAYLVKNFISEKELKNTLIIVPEASDLNSLESFFIDYDVLVFNNKNFIKKINFKNKNRVDFIELYKLFKDDFKISSINEIINTLLELKLNNFNNIDDIDFAFKDFKYHNIISYSYLKYSNYLYSNNLYDDADLFKLFIDEFNDFNYDNFILFGFDYFLSSDIEFIKKLANNINNSYIFIYDLFKVNNNYSSYLKQSLLSLNFKFLNINETKKNEVNIVNFKNIQNECNYIKNKLLEYKQANILALTKSNVYYYKLKKYFKNNIKYTSSLRIDKSVVFCFVKALCEIKLNNFTFNDLINLTSYKVFFKNNILKFINYLITNKINFYSLEEYLDLESKINSDFNKAYNEIKKLFILINEFKKTDTANNYIKVTNKIIDRLSLYKSLNYDQLLELNSFTLLLNKLNKFSDDSIIDLNYYILTLKDVSSFNYVLQGLHSFVDFNIISNKFLLNTSKNLIICGLDSVDCFKLIEEDCFIKDSIILKLREQNYLRPSSYELSNIRTSYINDLLNFYEITSNSINNLNHDKIKSIEKINIINKTINEDSSFVFSEEENFTIKNFCLSSLSPTSIENIIQCPYVFFMNNVLKISTPLYEDLDLESINEGTILHSFLEHYIDYYILNSNFTYEDIYLKVKDISSKLINLNKINKTYLLENLNFKITNYLLEFLPGEINFIKENNTKIIAKEKTIEAKLDIVFNSIDFSNISISGRIDRLDYSSVSDLYYIIDYKRKNIPKKNDLINSIKIQAQMYLLMLNYKNSEAVYISIKEKKKIIFKFSDLDFFKDNFIKIFKHKFDNIKENIFILSPSKISNCKECVYRSLCCTNRT